MTRIKHGVFISDIHMPDNIPLKPVLDYIEDVKPSVVILGGDIIDAKGLHASESMKAEQVKLAWFKRDVRLATGLIDAVQKRASAEIIYLAGNHENRYERLQLKYPDLFAETLDFEGAIKPFVTRYVPYATAGSYHKIGDTVFTHGDIFPESHAKPYALRYTPNKVVYGHLHHFQAYTTHRALLNESPRYAVTAGCLSTLNPEWKKGKANQWVNGFVSFITDGRVTTPTVHLIEKGRFAVGGKVYGD